MEQLELELEACRICVTCYPLQEMDFIHLYQQNEEFQQELDFIQNEIRQWQLKIQPDDGLPQRICANCFAKFCSIEAFRKECEAAQEKLIETVLQQTQQEEQQQQQEQNANSPTEQIIKSTDNPLPLMANYEAGNIVLDSSNNVLVSSVNLTQSDVSLNDFPVFDQQFSSHFDNPTLMDESSTLLAGNLIASEEATQELGFLPSQNLFTFETAEPPSTGTLPLVETDSTSIMNEILAADKSPQQAGGAGEEENGHIILKQDDLEQMLKHSIIPTTTKLMQQQQTQTKEQEQQENEQNREDKMDQEENVIKPQGQQFNNNFNTKLKNDYQTPTITFLNHEDSNSDYECDDTDMNVRLKGQSYACHYCFCPETGSIDHLVFPDEDALSQHFFDVHDPNRPYTCPKCTQSYKTQLLRDNHVRLTHKIVEIQTCNYCQKRLKGSTEVHQYNCQYIGDWECQHCKEKFPQTPLYRFRLHQRQHERIKPFKCRLCERTFAKKANLEAHQRMHKAEVTAITYTCNLCNATFMDDYELKRHNYQQHNAEHPLKCKICQRGFSSKVFLQRHLNQFHPDYSNNNSSSSSASSPSDQHVCLNCNVGFKTLQKLQSHLLLGRDSNGNCLYSSCNKLERRKLQRQGVFPCFHCPRRFHLRSQLDKHLNTHDARLRPYQCEQCVTRCRSAFELKQHVNVAHLNIKAFSCDKCGKCFGYKKDLRDHMLFHAEINVRCTEEGCDYACKNEKALNDHIRHKHRLLSCEYCHEQFTRQKLTAHLRKIHRNEIDVELAGESDNYYKSQLLNNNNDITQISFNLLNTQQQQEQLQLAKQSPQTTALSSTSSSSLSSSSPNDRTLEQSQTNINCSTSCTSTNSLLTSNICTTVSCGLPTASTTTSCSSSAVSNLSNTQDNDVDHHHEQLCDMFSSHDHVTNTSPTSLTLNGLVASSNDHNLNLVSNDNSNIFLVPSTATSSANDNQLDQYFMASLIDTEQEIIVT